MSYPNQVVLRNCGSNEEASVYRSLLDAHNIPCVIQGENHRSMLGAIGTYIDLNLMVAAEDLDRARAVLEAEADPESMQKGVQGLCTVHEAEAVTTCTRCGVFLCAQCDLTVGNSALCEDCDERLAKKDKQARTGNARLLVALLLLVFFLGPALMFALGVFGDIFSALR
jgi:hypothetical protein